MKCRQKWCRSFSDIIKPAKVHYSNKSNHLNGTVYLAENGTLSIIESDRRRLWPLIKLILIRRWNIDKSGFKANVFTNTHQNILVLLLSYFIFLSALSVFSFLTAIMPTFYIKSIVNLVSGDAWRGIGLSW